MRLLSSLIFLIAASYSLAAPMAPVTEESQRTTVEIVYETVTRTVIHEVTDPTTTVAEAEEEAVENTEGSGVVEEVTVPEISSPDQSDVLAPVAVASDTGDAAKPCECPTAATETATAASTEEAAADTKITEISGNVKMCSCDVADECRKESMKNVDSCMTECNEHVKSYGDNTDKYIGCFSKYSVAVVEAEDCLFKNKTDYCAAKDEAKFIEKTNWDDLTNIEYSSTADKTIASNSLWTRDEKKYNKFQSFFHCTKHCIHKKLQTCSAGKGCAIKMPAKDELAEKMKKCTKKNVKISNAILTTCQCLAWTHGVKDLQGSCVVIGNSYFVDRA